jgi:hypothetical protein
MAEHGVNAQRKQGIDCDFRAIEPGGFEVAGRGLRVANACRGGRLGLEGVHGATVPASAQKGIVHKNTASRRISRLTKRVKSLVG